MNNQQRKAIFLLWQQGQETERAIADEFSITRSEVIHVVKDELFRIAARARQVRMAREVRHG